MKRFLALSQGDFKNIYREPMQLLVALTPLLTMLILRSLLPVAIDLLHRHFAFDLTPHIPFIFSVLISLPALMYGMVIGFLMLDERDEQLLAYFTVTPLAKKGYLKQRVILPMFISFIMIPVMIYGSGFINPPFLRLIPIIFLVSLEAPLISLIIIATAANKVEGLVIAKGLGMMMAAPFPGYLLTTPWRYAAGIIPQFWVSQAFLGIMDRRFDYGWSLGLGFLVHLGYLALMIRLFIRRAE